LAAAHNSAEITLANLESIGLRRGPRPDSAAKLAMIAAEGARKIEPAFEDNVWPVWDHVDYARRSFTA